jgi:signal peptidase I
MGFSMHPFIKDGDTIVIEPKKATELRIGDIVLYMDQSGHHIIHRLIRKDISSGLITQGDNLTYSDKPVQAEHALGRVIEIERNGRLVSLDSPVNKSIGFLLTRLSPVSRSMRPVLRPFRKMYLKVFPFR